MWEVATSLSTCLCSGVRGQVVSDRFHIYENAVTQDLGVLARETNSKSSYSSSWSLGMKVRPETIGSETNTPPPYSFMCHAASGSFGSQATSSTSAGFPWKSTWSPFLISSPDLYFKTKECMSLPEGKVHLRLRFFGFLARSFRNSGSTQTVFSRFGSSSTFPYSSNPRTVRRHQLCY